MSVPKHIEKELELLREENALLRQKLHLLSLKVFGHSSEKLDIGQLLLFGDDAAKKPESDDSHEQKEASQKKSKSRKKRRSREATLPDSLEVEETIILPKEVEECPEAFRQIGEEVTTKLDYIPARFKKLITRRLKFVSTTSDDDCFYLADLPTSLKDRSLLTPSLAAEIATNRYCDHQPYYRQEQHFLMRHGVHLPRSTMSQWMRDLVDGYLSGIYAALHQDLLSEGYLQVDETPIQYLEPGNSKTKQGYFWALSRPDHTADNGRGDILYQWHLGRSANCLNSLLQHSDLTFRGVLQCDGYKSYNSYQTQRNQQSREVELIGCWAHVRRKFFEAKSDKPNLSGWVLKQINTLYQIEAELRKNRASPCEREAMRAWQSIPLFTRLEKVLKLLKGKHNVTPKSPLGKAVAYALGEWSKLGLCFKDGRLEIDNNLIENGIRPTKLGAKNWLFMGSGDAGQTNAVWFTLIESCRRRQINPRDYLVWVFEELPTLKVKADTFAKYTPQAYAQKLGLEQRFKKAS